jgi:hypothetical protein
MLVPKLRFVSLKQMFFGFVKLSFQDRVPNVDVGSQRKGFAVGRQPLAAKCIGMGMPTYNIGMKQSFQDQAPNVDVGNQQIKLSEDMQHGFVLDNRLAVVNAFIL